LIVEVLPGISSYSGIAAYNKVPITERGISSGFWVLTGTNADGQLTNDIHYAAQSSSNILILMGTRKLTQIIQLFRAHHDGDYPVALVQNGTLPDEKVVVGQLSNIIRLVEQEGIRNPAVIIIGEAARHVRPGSYRELG